MTFVRVLASLVLIGVLVAIGVGVYNAGVSAGLATQVVTPSGAPAVYYAGPYAWHGWGWGPGFGFFGIFFLMSRAMRFSARTSCDSAKTSS